MSERGGATVPLRHDAGAVTPPSGAREKVGLNWRFIFYLDYPVIVIIRHICNSDKLHNFHLITHLIS